MRNAWIATALLVTTAAAAAPKPDVVQLTNGTGSPASVGLNGPKFLAVSSRADLTPGAPGNADGSLELYLLDHKKGDLVQATNVADATAYVQPLRWLPDGTLLVQSNKDIADGARTKALAPGDLYVVRPPAGKRPTQIAGVRPAGAVTATFSFRGVAPNGRQWFLESKSDAVPGKNADLSFEVFVYDRKSGALRQITDGASLDSHFVGLADGNRRAVILSAADLSGKGANVPGASALFLVDLKTGAAEQISPVGSNALFGSQIDATGRWITMTTFVTTPGGQKVDVAIYDVRTKTSRHATTGGGVVFAPGAQVALITTTEDLTPASATSPGNADGSREVFTMDLKTGVVAQKTASSADTFVSIAGAKNGGPAVVYSKGDLAPGAPGNTGGVTQVFLVPYDKKPIVQLTNGSADSFPAAAQSGVLFLTSSADLAGGGDADGSREVFVANLKGAPKFRQLTSSAGDSFFAATAPDGRSVYVASNQDLTPGAPGNADGSQEIYRVKLR